MESPGLKWKKKGLNWKEYEMSRPRQQMEQRTRVKKERAAAIGNVVPHDIPKERNPCNTGLFASQEEAPKNVVPHDILGNHTTFSTELDAENTQDRAMSCYTTFLRVTRHLHRNSINIPRSSVSSQRFYVAFSRGIRLGFCSFSSLRPRTSSPLVDYNCNLICWLQLQLIAILFDFDFNPDFYFC